jgi:hypothetical protein
MTNFFKKKFKHNKYYKKKITKNFIIRFNSLGKYEQHSFKKRFKVVSNPNLKYKNITHIFLKRKILFEGVYYTVLRKYLKKVTRKSNQKKV